MSVNTAHANNGVLIHAGEYILLFSDNVTMEFSGQDNPLFKGSKSGRIYLTTHRMIYNSKNQSDPLQSFSFPFVSINDVDIEQPTFGANYIKGKVRAQPNGNWIGESKFKLYFKSGGAIDFGQAMLKAARMAQRNSNNDSPPPYTPPTGSWYEAPPPAYAPNPQGYYGWVPPTNAFPNAPPPHSVFMTDNPPPYPGLVPPPQAQGYPSTPFAPGAQNTSQYPLPQQSMGYPQGPPGYPPQGGYPQGPPGYPPQGGYPHSMGFSSGQPGGYFPQQQPGFQPQSAGGYPPQQPGYSQHNNSTAMTKEQDAAQSAYYDPNQPQTAYVPPAAYYEPPPSYNSVANKKDQ